MPDRICFQVFPPIRDDGYGEYTAYLADDITQWSMTTLRKRVGIGIGSTRLEAIADLATKLDELEKCLDQLRSLHKIGAAGWLTKTDAGKRALKVLARHEIRQVETLGGRYDVGELISFGKELPN